MRPPFLCRESLFNVRDVINGCVIFSVGHGMEALGNYIGLVRCALLF